MVYIHGFMGNETSFRSFPAHVHNLLTVLLMETHVVHTKIYPRYRSKRNISFARDDFSSWLEPHEDPKTDVVLCGHSMGGLLSAEVVLMPPSAPAARPLKHRILGTINFDVPFLGMHPGVVKSGLASIFQKGEAPGDQWSPETDPGSTSDAASSLGSPVSRSSSGRVDTLWAQTDPNYNPSFGNDVVLPMREGWKNALHFVNKHSGHLMKATKQLVTSHLEFGGAMANYGELKTRYGRIRGLEEEDESIRKSLVRSNNAPSRVRFVNYYTASTGRIKKPSSPRRTLSPSANQSQTSLSPSAAVEPQRGRNQQEAGVVATQSSRSRSPRISLEEHSDEGIVKKEVEMPSSDDEDWNEAAETLTSEDPTSIDAGHSLERETTDTSEMLSPTSTLSTTATLPPIPDLPTPPPALDVTYIKDQQTRKVVEKEHTRAVKSYEKAVKDREKAIRDRARLEQKKERKALKDAEKASKDAEKAKRKAETDAQKAKNKAEAAREMTQSEKEELRLQQERQRMEAEARRMRGDKTPEEEFEKPPAPLQEEKAPEEGLDKPSAPMRASEFISPEQAPALQQLSSASPSEASRSPSPRPGSKEQQNKPRKDRKFCTLPPKDSNGQRDPLWVRIFMENVDEVGAHCGLFFIDERYERLVGEVADRVERWVREDGDMRVVSSLGEGSGKS